MATAYIDNNNYSTYKSKKIGAWQSACDPCSFENMSETLYLTREGRFFLHCENGRRPKTELLSCRIGDSKTRETGDGLFILLSYEQARKWAEENLTVDVHETVFGPATEEAGGVPIALSIPADARVEVAELRAQLAADAAVEAKASAAEITELRAKLAAAEAAAEAAKAETLRSAKAIEALAARYHEEVEQQEGNTAAINRAIGLLETQLAAKDDEIRELHKLLEQSSKGFKKARKKAKRI